MDANSSAAASPLDPQLIGGRFRMEGLAGQGGMATVYRGVDTLTGDEVAVKLLKPEIIQAEPDIVARFDREGEALRRLNHPNIVKVLTTVTEQGQHYVVMEYVGGGDLRQLIDDHRRRAEYIPVSRILEIALDLSDALSRAHRLRIIHRDIKPANVLVAEDGTPRLTDFGVAQFTDSTRVTQSGAMIGTLAYLSPEACLGDALDARADIWAFGVMLYELLALRRPFEELSTAALLTAILSKQPESLAELRPDAPPALIALVEKMLVKDRDQRIDSVRQVGAQLEAIISGKDLPAAIEDTPTPATGMHPVQPERTTPLVQMRDAVSNLRTPPPSVDTGERIPDSLYPEDALSTPRSTTPGVTASVTIPHSGTVPPRRNPLWVVLAGVLALLVVGGVVLLVLELSGRNEDAGESSGVITLDPPAEGEVLVLVPQFEPFNNPTRAEPSGFVVEDLQARLEQNPLSNVRIRAYPAVITTAEAALAAAEANRAQVIVWGRYDDNGSRVNVHVGSLTAYPDLIFPRERLTEMLNVTATLTDERAQSLTPSIVGMLAVTYTGADDVFEISRAIVLLAEAGNYEAPTYPGTSTADYLHQVYVHYISDSERAIQFLDAAIRLNARNPLLYTLRTVTYHRLGQYEVGQEDMVTARRLQSENWAIPDTSDAISNLILTEDLTVSNAAFERAAALRRDDWFVLNFYGAVQYMLGDYEGAAENLNAALSLEPEANFPYVFASALALRNGDIIEGKRLFDEVLVRFPDPELSNRIAEAFYDRTSVITYAGEAFGSATLAQWRRVLTAVENATALNQAFVDEYIPDLYLLQGIAYCNQGDLAASEAAYTRLIDNDPGYILAYALRAEMRRQLGDVIGAGADLLAVSNSDQAANFTPLIPAFTSGEINCTNFLSIDLASYFENAEGGADPTAEATPGQ
ncbi:MAG: protein kinase [bacterium]|nr:protein kinase [bacterium]